MTIAELKTLLETTKLPVAYYKFPSEQEQELPVICFVETGSNNFIADDHVYQKISSFDIELYTVFRDTETEASLESVLDGADIPWEKTITYLDTELCYEVIYEIEVLIDGK